MDDRICWIMFLNIIKVIYLLFLMLVIFSFVEWVNLYLWFIKSYLCFMMGGEWFNVFMFLFIYKDIKVDVSKIIDIFVFRNLRWMLFENLIGD